MGRKKALAALAFGTFIVAVGLLCYTLSAARAIDYLGSDSKACINCHVMNVSYATWEHSAHRNAVACVDCHLPREGIGKYAAKARDGFNHAVAFAFETFEQAIVISDDGAKRVQANCVACHASLASSLIKNADLNHRFDEQTANGDRLCWSCHRQTPHGSVRAVSSAPNNLGVKF
ncbi:MAG: cytochrome c nitrite reductase small subunit [Helicobacteraceae bacterium]|jgi:cytochrome c nitrite reductase small subunit|nr:cytochrome c nitrite reductase small subunit [Helicobacteraceae bacterium]